ncbi:MAG: hypothetical protein EPO26_17580 [Chloroflexota bacterium]|nr:MAG: hypothetical protein EPO26_17580 [Chloroflexota bacterium]
MKAIALIVLAMAIGFADGRDRVTEWALVGPATIAYMVNGGGRELPVFHRPRLKDLPNGYWAEGTRVEVISGTIIANGQRWARVRGPMKSEGFALSRTLSSDPPRHSMDAGFARTARFTGPGRWVGEYAYCLDPAGGPRNLPPLLVHDAAARAAALWMAATQQNVTFTDLGDCESDATLHKNGVNTIAWGDPRDAEDKPIFANSWQRLAGDRIVEADIMLSAKLLARGPTGGPGWLSKRSSWSCLIDTVVHEFGHVVGLEHAPEGTLSVMRPGTNCMRTVYLPDIDTLNAGRLFVR